MTTSCHAVLLRRPSVTMAADSDGAAAVASRRKALNLVSSNLSAATNQRHNALADR
jgi:hypothetical protein